MAHRTETVHLDEDDIKAALNEWLARKYGNGKFALTIHHSPNYDEPDTYFARAERNVD